MVKWHVEIPPDIRDFVEDYVTDSPGMSGDTVSALFAAGRPDLAREELEALLEEGINSPSRPLTPAVWDEIRQRIGIL